MSVEFCFTCNQRIDTDWNVEGEYRNGEYMCERCCAKQDEQSMGIKDDKAQVSQSASSPKAAPTIGGVTAPGVSPTGETP